MSSFFNILKEDEQKNDPPQEGGSATKSLDKDEVIFLFFPFCLSSSVSSFGKKDLKKYPSQNLCQCL
jgi:hypothetical protein